MRALSNGIGPGAQAHGTHAICHAEFSMVRRVKFGTINASQLFFQGSHVFSIFKLRIHHKSGSLNNRYEYHATTQSTARKSAANVRAPSVTSSEPLPKRPENPSRATTVVVGRVHLGPRRDQLLDHGGVAVFSRPMQRRVASGTEDATQRAGRLRLPSRNKA